MLEEAVPTVVVVMHVEVTLKLIVLSTSCVFMLKQLYGHVCAPVHSFTCSFPSVLLLLQVHYSGQTFIHKNRLGEKNKRKDVALQRRKEWTHCVVAMPHPPHISHTFHFNVDLTLKFTMLGNNDSLYFHTAHSFFFLEGDKSQATAVFTLIH